MKKSRGKFNKFVTSNNRRFYIEELLNKELTYGQLTRGVLKEEPKRGNSKEKQLKEIEAICRIKTKEIITGKKNKRKKFLH